MVANITSLTGNGLRDWVVQRLSASVVAAYVVFVLAFAICKSPLTFEVWHNFFQLAFMRIFSVLFLLALVIHAWVGVWTVTTDYLKCTYIRVAVQMGFAAMLVCSLVWGVDIFWGM